MAPDHGQHTNEILTEIGRSATEIDALRANGVLG
jgi:crotonobetainyl-CoA:carnitine CoA-transferase CaiB-like acyl-CoA transferase